MKTLIATLCYLSCVVTIVAQPVIFFGEDTNTTGGRLEITPRADGARNAFYSQLIGVTTETFEYFPNNSVPTNLFGADIATFVGTYVVTNIPVDTFSGVWPISGDQCLLVIFGSGLFQIQFSKPQAAFGFYATDIGDNGSQVIVTLVCSDGTQTNLPIPSHTLQRSGSVLFFGVIDRSMPFTSLMFSNTLPAADGFGLDNMTIEQAPPDLQIWTAVELGVATQTGRLYQLQRTPQLAPAQWTNFGTQFVGNGSNEYFFDSTRQSGLQFYRFVTTNQ